MSTLSVRLPDSLHRDLKQVAEADGISVNQFINLAVAEKIAALVTYEIITRRAQGASQKGFLEAMAQVPKTPPRSGDEVEVEKE